MEEKGEEGGERERGQEFGGYLCRNREEGRNLIFGLQIDRGSYLKLGV